MNDAGKKTLWRGSHGEWVKHRQEIRSNQSHPYDHSADKEGHSPMYIAFGESKPAFIDKGLYIIIAQTPVPVSI